MNIEFDLSDCSPQVLTRKAKAELSARAGSLRARIKSYNDIIKETQEHLDEVEAAMASLDGWGQEQASAESQVFAAHMD